MTISWRFWAGLFATVVAFLGGATWGNQYVPRWDINWQAVGAAAAFLVVLVALYPIGRDHRRNKKQGNAALQKAYILVVGVIQEMDSRVGKLPGIEAVVQDRWPQDYYYVTEVGEIEAQTVADLSVFLDEKGWLLENSEFLALTSVVAQCRVHVARPDFLLTFIVARSASEEAAKHMFGRRQRAFGNEPELPFATNPLFDRLKNEFDNMAGENGHERAAGMFQNLAIKRVKESPHALPRVRAV